MFPRGEVKDSERLAWVGFSGAVTGHLGTTDFVPAVLGTK